MVYIRHLGKMGWKKQVSFLLVVVVVGLVLVSYFCGDNFCSFDSSVIKIEENHELGLKSQYNAYKQGMLPANDFPDTDLDRFQQVQFEKEDVIVFLHMQKTGGTTFGRHLVKNLDLESPCKCYKKKKRCDCLTSKKTIWLFSRYSTGWICGLHADWTELNTCVEDAMNKKEKIRRTRKYHYITILRDPVKRYLSEWKHVQRGATWKDAKLFCNGRSATKEEVKPCFETEDWRGVSLNEFLHCDHNLARNRMTRMLANLTKVNCYNSTGMPSEQRDTIMLDSAKMNLLHMDFFGITEFQVYTQKLFEYTFQLRFREAFEQLPVTHSDKTKIEQTQQSEILEQNKLDIELYQYAKDLFLQRVRKMKEDLDEEWQVDEEYLQGEDRFDDSVDIKEETDEDDYS